MANCNKLFLDFNSTITPTSSQMDKMRNSRIALEEKISQEIRDKIGVTVSFFTQGSGTPKMKTIIIKEDGTYDVDRGVYLPEKPGQNPYDIQKIVYDAVNDHTAEGAMHKNKCIRVIYRAAYNIDLPVYYEVRNESYAYIAHKSGQWIKDDPSHMIDWFVERKDENGQLIRLVKYLKVWASKTSVKMPSGIALTVWAAQQYQSGIQRDDQALAQLLFSICISLRGGVHCNSPVEPFDDLVSKLSNEQKQKFLEELEAFAAAARHAIEEPNQLKASKIWQNYLGTRFEDGIDQNLEEKEQALLASSQVVLGGAAKLSRSGQINSSTGVQHQTHRNYGF